VNRKKKNKKQRKRNKQIRLRNKKLCKKYPFLIPRNCWTSEVVKDYDYSYTEYDCIDKGWQIGFGKLLLEDLRKACIETNFLNDLRFLQIKEKYARLEMYADSITKKVDDVITAYGEISESVCHYCGSIKAQPVNEYGWYLPVCEHCWDKNNIRYAERGFEIKPYSEVANKNYPGLRDYYEYRTCRSNEIVRVDISEYTNKVRKAYEKRMKIKNKKEHSISIQ
jgi:hypothetical protein